MDRPIVLVTGVFDLLHPGHVMLISYLKHDYPNHELVVGVNGDRRAQELKDVVLFNAIDRVIIMNSIIGVDRVEIFEGDNPADLIRQIKPSVFVKGTDWEGKELPEAEACQEVGAQIIYVDTGYLWHSSDFKRRLIDAHRG